MPIQNSLRRTRMGALLFLLAFALITLVLLEHHVPGIRVLISNYNGPLAVVSHWVLPNVISNYNGPVTIISGYHGIHTPSIISYYGIAPVRPQVISYYG